MHHFKNAVHLKIIDILQYIRILLDGGVTMCLPVFVVLLKLFVVGRCYSMACSCVSLIIHTFLNFDVSSFPNLWISSLFSFCSFRHDVFFLKKNNHQKDINPSLNILPINVIPHNQQLTCSLQSAAVNNNITTGFIPVSH